MSSRVLKIQSVSDIITNSSSEVFMIYNEDSIKQIKELVNAILSLNEDNKYTFDDLFTIEICFDKDRLMEYTDDDYEGLSDEELFEKAQEYDEENYSEGYPIIDGYVVKAKDIKDESIAKKLSRIDKIFDTYVAYC